jgi:hypothetical protein
MLVTAYQQTYLDDHLMRNLLCELHMGAVVQEKSAAIITPTLCANKYTCIVPARDSPMINKVLH